MALVVGAGLSLTGGLTYLAFQTPEPVKPKTSNVLPTKSILTPKKTTPPKALPTKPKISDSKGGSNEEATVDDDHDGMGGPLEELRLPRKDRLTSGYGMRNDPFKNRPAFHGGIDLAGEHRSEVDAALDGKVKYVGWKGGYGKVIILDHGGGYETLYGHLEKFLVKKGQQIVQGDLLGLVGSTGRSTGPHVHFELWKDGKKIDPIRAKLMAHIQ